MNKNTKDSFYFLSMNKISLHLSEWLHHCDLEIEKNQTVCNVWECSVLGKWILTISNNDMFSCDGIHLDTNNVCVE